MCVLDYTHILYMCVLVLFYIYIYVCTYTYNLIKIFMDPELTNMFLNELSTNLY